MNNIDYSLYLITDRTYLKDRSLFDAVEEAIKAGVTVVQLREKNISDREFYEMGLKLREVTKKYGVPLIINDRVDIAIAVDADGVHLGQEELPAKVVREVIGYKKIIGVSASSLKEAEEAYKCGADYIGVGAIFPTPSKKDAKYVGLQTLKEITEKIPIPVLAIGGITKENIQEVLKYNIKGVCCISAILKGDISENVRFLKDIIKRNMG
ncbi:MAG: thiamine phosphate synthase [Thermovenabulum sp.]|uniref:thiamine phosphate synthase n=1 Tax=Thermovenabulum sp. TaxID=3100335 RepID=UPI003C7E2686